MNKKALEELIKAAGSVKTGGIHASTINAENVVSGIQINIGIPGTSYLSFLFGPGF